MKDNLIQRPPYWCNNGEMRNQLQKVGVLAVLFDLGVTKPKNEVYQILQAFLVEYQKLGGQKKEVIDLLTKTWQPEDFKKNCLLLNELIST